MDVKKRISHAILALILVLGSVLNAMPVWAGSGTSGWTAVTPAPTGNDLRGVVYGNGIYVAVGGSGTILTSTSGTGSWESHGSGTEDLNGVVCGLDDNGSTLFATVGSNGTILTSYNGTVWVSQVSGTTDSLNGITYGGGQFAAVGSNGTILTSADGIIWASMTDSGTPYTANNLNGITCALIGEGSGRDTFVAVGGGGTILTSTDGESWSDDSDSGVSIDDLFGVAYGLNGQEYSLFSVVGNNGTILNSSDGTSWTKATNPAPTANLKGITYGGGQFVAVGNGGTILISVDEAAWATQTSGTTNVLYGIACGSNDYVAVGQSGTILYSGLKSAAGVAAITSVRDVGNNGNGSDLEVSFQKADDESLVSEYRIMVVYSFSAGKFNMIKANAVSNYTAVSKTGGNIVKVLGNGATEIDGYPIGDGYDYYKVFVLTVADGTNATVNTLSEASPEIRLDTDMNKWKWANPLPTGNRLKDVAYGNGLYVAVGESGTIMTSPDGTSWTSRKGSFSKDLNSVAYGKDRFVAGGYGGDVLVSVDGIHWSEYYTETWSDISGVSYGQGLFVAVYSGGYISTSPDGKTWTQRESSGPQFQNVSYSGDIFIAVGLGTINNKIETSPDGRTWTKQTTDNSNIYLCGAARATVAGSTYVAVGLYNGGDDTILTSSDAQNWTSLTSVDTEGLFDVIYGGGLYIAVGNEGTILTSSDGTNWTSQNSGLNSILYGVTYGNVLYVVVGASGTILTSTNGTDWTERSTSVTDSYLYGTLYDEGRFLVAAGSSVLSSPDGDTWYSNDITSGCYLSSIGIGKDASLEKVYVAVGDNGYPGGSKGIVMNSTDSTTWSKTLTRTANNTPIESVAYGNGIFVAVGRNDQSSGDYGVILTSTDGGSTWSIQGDGSTAWDRLYSVTYGEDGSGNDLFVAVGYNGIILTSPNGTNWSKSSASGSSYYDTLKGITFSNNLFVAVGVYGRIVTSSDGSSWSETSYSSVNLNGITYCNGYYVAVGDSGRIFTSTDGVIWTVSCSGITNNALYGISYGNGVYVAAGADGTILTSGKATVSSTPTTATVANNTVSVNPANTTAGNAVTITAIGDRQAQAGSVIGDERYIPTTWTSTEAGKNGTFTVTGSVYTSDYTPSSAGTYTITATFQKQTWDGSAWNDASGSTDTKTTSLTVTIASVPTTANASNNTVNVNPASIIAGNPVTITAAGDRQGVAGSVYGDERYIPAVWTSTEADKNGTFTVTGSSSYTPSLAGSYTITATFLKQTWNGSSWNDVTSSTDTKTAPLTVNNSGSDSGGSGGRPGSSNTGNTTAAETSQTGLGSIATGNGTATVDPAKLAKEISARGTNSVIVFAITGNADKAAFNLTVADLKAIADNGSMLQLESPLGIYKFPAAEIDFDAISKQYPNISYKDIKVTVAFSKAKGNNAILGGSRLVGQPVSITVSLTTGDKVIELDEFTKYVERDLPIPDASKFTTGVVIEEDGTLRHVPTKTVTVNGKKYAAIFSRTNSVYSLVSKAVSFDDMEGHWAKEAVNDMASRLIISGVGNNNFAPGRDITRAEFATIVIGALGLKAADNADFTDVKSGSWYYGAVGAAYKYGIVSGYGDGTFRPNSKITRQEAMAMTARAMKVAGMDISITNEAAATELAKFIDGGSFSGWAGQAAAAVIRSGLVAGSEGYARPERNITRAETAAIVRRLLEKAGLI